MYVVGPAVQEDDRWTISRTGFHISDIQKAGIDLLHGAKRRVRPVLDLGHPPASQLPFCRAYCENRSNGHGYYSSAEKATAKTTEFFRTADRTHW
jgi:hypothetical protein